MPKTDFHIHSSFCDGADTPEQLAAAAVAAGFDAIGFSGHSFTPFDVSYCMSEEGTAHYFRQLQSLKRDYAGTLQIFCGVEQDLAAPAPAYSYDYVIGSVHYLPCDGALRAIDHTPALTASLAREQFGGDYAAMCACYFSQTEQLVKLPQLDIIGHFDLITKFSDTLPLPDEEFLLSAARKAADLLLESGAVFELNTGAMARGYRGSPYPSRAILRYLAAQGARIVLSSDCHKAACLGYGFAQARQLALECGFFPEQLLCCPPRLSACLEAG